MRAFSTAKTIISCITAAGMLAWFSFCPTAVYGAGTASDTTDISDAASLAAIADAPEEAYRLTADIDLGGADWTPIAFSGRLDGGGHTLYNLHVTNVGGDKRESRDGNLKPYDTEYAGLFSVLENAEITNLQIQGGLVEIAGRSHCFAALLAGYSDSSVIKNCSVSGRVHMQSGGINAGVAGIIGYGTGKISKCSADVELVFEDNYRDGKCEQFLGGILSSGVGDIQHCKVKIDGYVSCHGYVHNGGLVGMYYHSEGRQKKGNVRYNSVSGQISFFEDNTDRRAYCRDLIGERLTTPKLMNSNTSQFKSNETKDYSKVLSPEKCAQPDYEETVTPPGCESWGHTAHQCRGCGYAWIDTYTPPAHAPGEWVTVSDSDFEREGLQRRYCSECGELTDERAIPVKMREEAAKQDKTALYAAVIGGIAVLAAAARWFLLRRKRKTGKDADTTESTD